MNKCGLQSESQKSAVVSASLLLHYLPELLPKDLNCQHHRGGVKLIWKGKLSSLNLSSQTHTCVTQPFFLQPDKVPLLNVI